MRISIASKSTHIIALTGGLFFMFSLSAYALFFQQVEQIKETLISRHTEFAQIEKKREVLSTLIKTLESTKNERASITQRVLTEDHVVDILTLIEEIGREQQVVLKTNTISVKPINNVFETVVISVSVEGSYEALVSTLTLFENMPYQCAITNVRFTRNENSDMWETQYDIQVTKYKNV